MLYNNDQFYQNQKSLNDNSQKYKEADKYNIDDGSRMRLGKVRGDKFDDIVLYYQGYKYFESTPNITSIRPEMPDGLLVGIRPIYVEKTNSQVIDVSGTLVPINMIKAQNKINYSVFN